MLRILSLSLIFIGMLTSGCSQLMVEQIPQETIDVASTLTSPISADDLRSDVAFLASDECGGRLTGSPGVLRAGQYIATALKNAGFQPGGKRGSFYQSFEFISGVHLVESKTSFEILASAGATGSPCKLNDDYCPRTFSASGSAEGEVVFAGYGLVEAGSPGKAYDSYRNLDVTGKVVLILRDVPEEVTPKRRQELALYAGDRYKAKLAADRGAKAVLLVSGPNSAHAGKVTRFYKESRNSAAAAVTLSISGKMADRLLAGAGTNLKQLQDMLDNGQMNPHAAMSTKTRVRLSVSVNQVRSDCRNVIAILPPQGGSDEYVAIGAHYDHIGTGEGLGSMAKAGQEGMIHNGADDNASGTAVVLEIVADLAEARRQADPNQPMRGLVVALWSGEELGLIGSSRYVEDPAIPLDKVVAYVNFDMVGRLRDNTLIIQAVGSSPLWRRIIERRNIPAGFQLVLQDDPYLPTDATSFYTKGVATLSFFTDMHEDYNCPSDDTETLNYEGMERIALLAKRLVADVSNPETEVAYLRVQRSAPAPGRMSRRAYTGTIPDMGAGNVVGVKLADVRDGGPAAKAGMKSGDVIVEFAGQKIANLQDYSDALIGVKIGQSVAVVIERDGARIDLTITPTSRPE